MSTLLQITTVPIFPPLDHAGFFFGLFVLGFWAAAILLHIACALAVAADGKLYARHHRRTVLLTPGFWTLVSLFTGLLGLVAYWALHRSTLNPGNLEPSSAEE